MTRDTREQYAVYHANDPHAMVAPQPERWFGDRARHYRHVADVEAPLGRVFALTNHIDRPWTENPEVVWHISATPLRSTSVGDVLVSPKSGNAWLVMPPGLQELAPEDEPGWETPEGDGVDTPQPSDEGKEGRS